MSKSKCEIVHLNEVDSTNRYALENFEKLPELTLVTSTVQTDGRGRRGRTWVSPPDVNIYASLLIKNFPFPVFHSSWIGSLGVLYSLRKEMGKLDENISPWIKWPNDIYCDYKKISGILCELKSDPSNNIEGTVVGMGVNLNLDSESLHAIDQPATSVLDLTGRKVDVKKFVSLLANNLTMLYSNALLSGTADIYTDWKKENKLIDRDVEINKEDGSILRGRVLDFGQDGELVLKTADGSSLVLHSGDISIKKNFKI